MQDRSNNTKAITKTTNGNGSLMRPGSLGEAMQLAKVLANTNLVPKGFQGKPDDIMAAIVMGSDVGLAPMQALRSIAVINGRPCLWGDGALAVVMAHPDFEDITEDSLPQIEKTGQATCTIKRRGQKPHAVTYTVDLAKKAKLWGKQGPWIDHPARMLQIRARGWALRDRFPDALGGIHIAEEAVDSEPIDITPQDLPGNATPEQILERIESSTTEQDLATMLVAAKVMPDGEEKDKIKAVYKAKLGAVRGAVEPPTGKAKVGGNGKTKKQPEPEPEKTPAPEPEPQNAEPANDDPYDYGPPPLTEEEQKVQASFDQEAGF